jgi:hypothetical protein
MPIIRFFRTAATFLERFWAGPSDFFGDFWEFANFGLAGDILVVTLAPLLSAGPP